MKWNNLFLETSSVASQRFAQIFLFIFEVLNDFTRFRRSYKNLWYSPISVSMQPKFSNSQILSIFPQHPVGGTPYSPPPYPPTAMAWAQHGLLANRWPSPVVATCPTLPIGLWGNSGVQPEAQGCHPGVMNGGITPRTALNVSGDPAHIHPPNTGSDLLQ